MRLLSSLLSRLTMLCISRFPTKHARLRFYAVWWTFISLALLQLINSPVEVAHIVRACDFHVMLLFGWIFWLARRWRILNIREKCVYGCPRKRRTEFSCVPSPMAQIFYEMFGLWLPVNNFLSPRLPSNRLNYMFGQKLSSWEGM